MKKLTLERLASLQPKIRKAYLDAMFDRSGFDYAFYLVDELKKGMDEVEVMGDSLSKRYRLTQIYAENFESYESKLN
jgi:hypothetical protein